MSVNKQYKDSVFSLLFSDPGALRDLYGALDLSFKIGGKAVALMERQSAINPNMALMLLLYIARVYEKIIDNKSLYRVKKAIILRIEFIVLYNGVADYPAESVLRLSDSFERIGGFGLPDHETPALELAVKVYNSNEGRNEEMVRRRQPLRGYSAFVAKVRERQAKGGGKEVAMKAAVRRCVEHGILKEFLESNAANAANAANAWEVRNMVLPE
ncbi:MAG: hypothetical protein LBK73_09850 [Treponema sp.]|jgi:hypothetical protein|nr:hypothetical protein [Treponema sp.]